MEPVPRSRPRRILAASIMGAILPACREEERVPVPLFTEVTESAGIPAPAAPWPDGRYEIPEITASGVALFDPDGDGDLDIYLVCHPPPGASGAAAPNRLFRQTEKGRFVEAPGAAGLDDGGYGNGAAVGDVDGDGDPDVYVCNVGSDALYVNAGGTFADATARVGLRDAAWSSAAAFLDADRDGDLDLYVVHYVVNDPTRVCQPSRQARREYCGPARYQSAADALWRNRGDGAFTDVSLESGITQARAGLGLICVDLTGDGWVDIYVANDRQPNQLHVNRRDGTFSDEALERGLALNGSGEVEASMGVAAGDVNGDARLDLFVTSLAGETSTLYLASAALGPAGLAYADRSAPAGLGAATLNHTGWGCGLVDFDNDGDLDLAVANGRIERGPVHPGARLGPFWNEYAEASQVFLDEGGGKFSDASQRNGELASVIESRRALAFGDLDGDGDVDMVSSDVSNRLRIFRNDAAPAGNHWLRVRAVTGKRDALGALVTIEAGGVRQIRPVISAYSYASASEAVAHFGLGSVKEVAFVEVAWPDGRVERFAPGGIDRVAVVREGEGSPATAR